MTIFVNFFEKNVKFLAISLTVKWQFSGGSDRELVNRYVSTTAVSEEFKTRILTTIAIQ